MRASEKTHAGRGARAESGVRGRQELSTKLQSLGVSADAANRAADAADYDGSGKIEWSEFVAAMLPASQELFATALQVAFSHFDTNHDGAPSPLFHLRRSCVHF